MVNGRIGVVDEEDGRLGWWPFPVPQAQGSIFSSLTPMNDNPKKITSDKHEPKREPGVVQTGVKSWSNGNAGSQSKSMSIVMVITRYSSITWL